MSSPKPPDDDDEEPFFYVDLPPATPEEIARLKEMGEAGRKAEETIRKLLEEGTRPPSERGQP